MAIKPKKPTFHAFTVKHKGIVNRIITDIKFSPAFDPYNPPDPIKSVETQALWDTGADGSVLTHSIVAQLGLIPTGRVMIEHAGGSSSSSTYIVNIYLPNRIVVPGVVVTDCPDIDGFGALIGMDIISKGDFALTNFNNDTYLSFRIPSIARIDYVEEAERLNFSGISRHDPCPCGRLNNIGLPVKFKDCHAKQKKP